MVSTYFLHPATCHQANAIADRSHKPRGQAAGRREWVGQLLLMKLVTAFVMIFALCQGLYAQNQTLKVPPGQNEFTIELPANPTTGYQWTIASYDSLILQKVSSRFVPPDNTRMGAGGTMVFRFRLHNLNWHPVGTHVRFEYARPWEKKPVKTSDIHVVFAD